jgi:hypothetical protein
MVPIVETLGLMFRMNTRDGPRYRDRRYIW